MDSKNNEYHKIIHFFGTLSNASAQLGVSKPAIVNWKSRGVPAHQAIRIESITKGRLKASELFL